MNGEPRTPTTLRLGFNDEIRDTDGRVVARISFRVGRNEFFLAEDVARATTRELVERYNCHPGLLAEIATLRRDATRYRWMRSRWEGPVHFETVSIEGPDTDLDWGDERIGEAMDEAIDAALALAREQTP